MRRLAASSSRDPESGIRTHLSMSQCPGQLSVAMAHVLCFPAIDVASCKAEMVIFCASHKKYLLSTREKSWLFSQLTLQATGNMFKTKKEHFTSDPL